MCFGVFFVGGNEPDGEYLRSQSTNVAAYDDGAVERETGGYGNIRRPPRRPCTACPGGLYTEENQPEMKGSTKTVNSAFCEVVCSRKGNVSFLDVF